MTKKKIPEIRYRASRICRAMGNPTAYEILYILRKGKKTPDQLAHILGISVSTVSQALRVLRNLDLVRYEVDWRFRNYRIKTDIVNTVMIRLEHLVKSSEALEY